MVCSNCALFTQFYERGLHNFYPRKFGNCGVKEQIVKEDEICDLFCKRETKRATAENVSGAISAVKELKKIFR